MPPSEGWVIKPRSKIIPPQLGIRLQLLRVIKLQVVGCPDFLNLEAKRIIISGLDKWIGKVGVSGNNIPDISKMILNEILGVKQTVQVVPFQPAFRSSNVIDMIVSVNKHARIIGCFDQAVVFVKVLSELGAVCIVKVINPAVIFELDFVRKI